MRFGAMNFPVSPILQEIEAFAALGFDFLELAMDPPAAHVSTNQIDTIKVTKGPFDVTTQGGLGGQINVITKPLLNKREQQ